MKNKGVFSDFGLNFFAAIIVTMVLNIGVYPFLAIKYSESEYGEILVIIGLVNMLFSILGNTLNNVRLLENCKYLRKKIQGDFQLLNIIAIVIGVIVCFFSVTVIYSVKWYTKIQFMVLTVFGIARAYFIADYRMNLNFKKQVKANILLLLGYALGILVNLQFNDWPLIFLFGEGISFLYVSKSSSLVKEKVRTTSLFQNTLKSYLSLLILSVFGNILIYCDRFLIYPILGASMVTVFSVASFWGRSLGVIFEPLASVLLGYFTQNNFAISCKKYVLFYLSCICVTIGFVVAGIWIAPYVLKILYPTIVSQAREYIPLASAATGIVVSVTLIRPMVLTITAKKKILYLQLIYGGIYIGLAVWLSNILGLKGFIIGIFVANLINSIGMFTLGYVVLSYKNFKSEENI